MGSTHTGIFAIHFKCLGDDRLSSSQIASIAGAVRLAQVSLYQFSAPFLLAHGLQKFGQFGIRGIETACLLQVGDCLVIALVGGRFLGLPSQL